MWLQTKNGNPAKGLTLSEFKARFAAIKRALTAKWKEQLGDSAPAPIFIWDNGRFHTDDPAAVGLRPQELLPIPPYSPDINKVVEHAHKSVKERFHNIWDAFPSLKKRVDAETILRKLWKELDFQEAVEKDALTLPATFAAIIESKGDHVARKFR